MGRSHRLGEALAEYQSSTLPAPTQDRLAVEDVEVPAPSGLPTRKHRSIGITTGPFGALQDYRNRQLGKAGEEWVVDVERESLVRAGRRDLADLVVWVANDVGDGAGYDIASFRKDGAPLLIEVKTTNLGLRTPFYVTRWEVEVSSREATHYSLYRVFDFRSQPRLYCLPGSIAESSRLEPSVFVGLPK